MSFDPMGRTGTGSAGSGKGREGVRGGRDGPGGSMALYYCGPDLPGRCLHSTGPHGWTRTRRVLRVYAPDLPGRRRSRRGLRPPATSGGTARPPWPPSPPWPPRPAARSRREPGFSFGPAEPSAQMRPPGGPLVKPAPVEPVSGPQAIDSRLTLICLWPAGSLQPRTKRKTPLGRVAGREPSPTRQALLRGVPDGHGPMRPGRRCGARPWRRRPGAGQGRSGGTFPVARGPLPCPACPGLRRNVHAQRCGCLQAV